MNRGKGLLVQLPIESLCVCLYSWSEKFNLSDSTLTVEQGSKQQGSNLTALMCDPVTKGLEPFEEIYTLALIVLFLASGSGRNHARRNPFGLVKPVYSNSSILPVMRSDSSVM